MVKRKATIVEVAERAHVAFSTVSRVLNGGYASPEVRGRVEQAAKDLGYVPSSIARNLKMGRQGCIGVVVQSSQSSWFTQLLGGIEEALEEKRTVSVLLGSLVLRGRYDPSAVTRWITDRRVDGLIFARCTRHQAPLVERARKARLPMVFIAPDEHFGAGAVFGTRNREAGRALGEHLLGLGHRRFGFAGGPEDSIDTQDRLAGLRDALAEKDIPLNPAHRVFTGAYTSEAGMAYAEHWLSLPRAQAPTAIVCGNDALGLGVLRTVLQHGVRVPGDVSVAGFDAVPEGALTWPGLTTVRQPSQAMGSAACRELLRTIDGDEIGSAGRRDLDAELVIRESTGPAPAASRR